MSGKCPYSGGNAPAPTEVPASSGKCPYSSGATPASETAPAASAGKCPYSSGAAAPAAAPSSSGKCPYSGGNAAVSAPAATSSESTGKCPYMNKDSGSTANDGRPFPYDGHIPYGSAEGASDWSTASGDAFKKHFQDSYDRVAANAEAVAATAPNEARLQRARRNAAQCGYTDAELEVIGADVWMLQGTGNPHKAAKIQNGETVVDLGSGFGIDAIIAASKVGAEGRVIGIDLSIREISNAILRAHGRGLRNLDFRYGDIEEPPVTTGTADVVMSNGGFCLVPNKRKAFAEIARMLKAGSGRLSVSCTVRLQELEKGKNWPSCFLVFMPMEDVIPVLTECGFVDIAIERCPKEEKEEAKPSATATEGTASTSGTEPQAKATVHSTGHPDYAFLKNYNMDELFACVNIYARKA